MEQTGRATKDISVNRDHFYGVRVEWTGNTGSGTSGYRDYRRDNLVTADAHPPIDGSADVPFRGTPGRWNPEQLLLAALSQCHMLSYFHVAVRHGIVVTGYIDDAVGQMRQEGDGGHFTSVTLRPAVTISAGDPETARAIHSEAGALCFIASSVNFPVSHEPTIRVKP
jgi:organic hydroperoxide reductase OsmC/OhrA